MNKEQILSTVRTVLQWFAATTAGVWLFHKFDIPTDPSTVTVLAGIVVGIGTYVWSLLNHRVQSIVSKAAKLVWVPESSQLNAGIPPEKVKPPPPPPANSNT